MQDTMKAPKWFVESAKEEEKVVSKIVKLAKGELKKIGSSVVIKGSLERGNHDSHAKLTILVQLKEAMDSLRWARFRYEQEEEGNVEFARASTLTYEREDREIVISEVGKPHDCDDEEGKEEGDFKISF